jgi:hypothetical protein
MTDDRAPLWLRVQERGEIRYRLNPEHPVVADLAAKLPDDSRDGLLRLLELASAALPLDALLADLSGEPEKVGSASVADRSLKHALLLVVEQLRSGGLSNEDIRDALQVTEPFRTNWERAEGILNSMSGEDTDE